jgi:EAL domain-containing protein (putative c-di-GMP-specific phosphodiesterase class I)
MGLGRGRWTRGYYLDKTVIQPANNVLLAVDDEQDFLDLVAQVAQGVGYIVLTANSAAAFREHIANASPSLILLDLQIPGMDGVEMLRYLAAHCPLPEILLVSGMDQRVISSARTLGRSLGLKMSGALQKPAMLEEIEALLQKHWSDEGVITEQELRKAVDEFEFIAHYQPKLVRHGASWKVAGAEALVRWKSPERGLLYPASFLPLVESTGMITALTDIVMTDAIRQVGHWGERGQRLSVAVNLSPRLVGDVDFPERLQLLLREYSVSPDQLTLEVTEAASLSDPELVMDIFTQLRVKGVGLSLDDFGTGTSSLTHLYKMPFNEVKIDRTLIAEAPFNRAAASIVRAIVDLAHTLSLNVCAEGVENDAVWQFVADLPFDSLQGDAISKAVPAAEVEQLIERWSERSTPIDSGLPAD